MSAPVRIGAYRVVRLLRRGGQAEVYEASLDRGDGFTRRVAIKLLLAGVGPEERERFIQEGRLAAQLHHGGIVAVLDVGADGDTPFQVLELVDGIHFRAATALARVSTAAALHVVAELGDALGYAHHLKDGAGRNLDVVHRDVAPDNVLLSWVGDVKLGDFGIARALNRPASTRVGVVHGRRPYLAPERARGEVGDFRVDLFSLGVLLHALLAGNNPLDDERVQAAVVSGGAFPVDPSLAPDLALIVERATRSAPAERPSGARAIAAQCRRALLERDEEDGREALRAWLGAIAPRAGDPSGAAKPAERRPLSEMLNPELVLDREDPPASGARTHSAAEETYPGEETTIPASTTEPEVSDSEVSDPVALEALVGQVFDGMRVERAIGRGGHGQVYAVTRLEDGRSFALKVLPVDAKPQLVARFRREAEVVASLSHPNLVRIHRHGLVPGRFHYLLMDLIEGGSLAERIGRVGALGLETALRLGRQIALGLAEIHRRGVIHRDLKPTNIVLSGTAPNEQLKLVDFGVAGATDGARTRMTRLGLLGTPSFMAPEQFSDPHGAGPEADLYALGVVLYVMITGTQPFTGSVDAIRAAHREGKLPDLEPVGAAAPLLLALLAKDPARRPRSARAVIEEIDRLLGESTRTTPSLERVEPRPLRGRREGLWVVALVAPLGLAIVAAAALRDQRPKEVIVAPTVSVTPSASSLTPADPPAPPAVDPPRADPPERVPVEAKAPPARARTRPSAPRAAAAAASRAPERHEPEPVGSDLTPSPLELREALDRFLAALEAARGTLEAEQLKRFDLSYLDLEARLAQAKLTPEEARGLAQRIQQQRTQLDGALAAHPVR